MQTTRLSEVIKGRRSIRAWQDRPVPEELLKQAIELATCAPNAGNQQIWYFYIIVNNKTVNAIADAVQASADYIATWPEAIKMGDPISRMLKHSATFRSAPAAIAVAAKQYVTPTELLIANRAEHDARARDIRDGRNISNARIQSIGAVVGYLLLVLHQMGLGAVWLTGPMQAKREIERILNMPKDMDLVAIVPVGYPAENPDSRGRKPVDEVCQVIR